MRSSPFAAAMWSPVEPSCSATPVELSVEQRCGALIRRHNETAGVVQFPAHLALGVRIRSKHEELDVQ